MSSKNPFRKPAPSERVKVAPPPSPPLPALPQRTPSPPLPAVPQSTASPVPPALPPRSPISGPSFQSAIQTSSSHGIPPDILSTPPIAENIDDDLPPPPYTPAAIVGEETVGLGPLRPFQRPPPIPPSSLHPPPDSRHHSNWPLPSAQLLQPSPTGMGSNSGFRMQPEPRLGVAPWQTQQQYRQRQNAGGGLLGALFDTVRDIADAVSGTHDERMMASRRANVGAYAAPYSNTGTLYAPPPVPPVQMHEPLPPRPVSTPPRSPPSTVPDDGSPTRTPVPGHPLLRSGHLLVYPRDHLCVKCGFLHSLTMMRTLTHGQARTRVTKTTIPPIHAANVGTNMESRIPAHSHTRNGLHQGTIPECNVPFRNSYHPI